MIVLTCDSSNEKMATTLRKTSVEHATSGSSSESDENSLDAPSSDQKVSSENSSASSNSYMTLQRKLALATLTVMLGFLLFFLYSTLFQTIVFKEDKQDRVFPNISLTISDAGLPMGPSSTPSIAMPVMFVPALEPVQAIRESHARLLVAGFCIGKRTIYLVSFLFNCFQGNIWYALNMTMVFLMWILQTFLIGHLIAARMLFWRFTILSKI